MDTPDWLYWNNITQQNYGGATSSSISSSVLMAAQAPHIVSRPDTAIENDLDFSPPPIFPTNDDVLKLDYPFQDQDDFAEFTWEKAKTSDQLSCSNFVSQRNSIIANSSSLPNQSQVLPGVEDTANCVLITADTLEESSGISMILSDCQNSDNMFTNNTNSSKESDKGDIRTSESNENIDPGKIRRSNPSSSRTGKGKNSSKPKVGFSKRVIDFSLAQETSRNLKKPRLEKKATTSSSINFQGQSSSAETSTIQEEEEYDPEEIAQFKEIIYCAAALKPVNLDIEVVDKPKRKNVKISSDPQTVAARQRRERISERIRVLQRLVPGGSKLDTATMLDEAANYLKFLKSRIKALENLGHKSDTVSCLPMNLVFSPFPLYHSFPMTSPTPYQTQENANHSQGH